MELQEFASGVKELWARSPSHCRLGPGSEGDQAHRNALPTSAKPKKDPPVQKKEVVTVATLSSAFLAYVKSHPEDQYRDQKTRPAESRRFARHSCRWTRGGVCGRCLSETSRACPGETSWAAQVDDRIRYVHSIGGEKERAVQRALAGRGIRS